MFSVTHFRSEFIYQGQATILRKVTMTQFLFVVSSTLLGIGVFGLPWWLTPVCMALGYIAGISYHGELLVRRLIALLHVRARELVAAPRIVNLQTAWEQQQRTAAQKQALVPAAVVLAGAGVRAGAAGVEQRAGAVQSAVVGSRDAPRAGGSGTLEA